MKYIRNRVLRFIIIAVIIAAGIFFIANRYKERESTDITDFSAPSIPIMYMNYNGASINRMFGYKTETTTATERESLTLLLSDRMLTVQVNPCGREIDTLSYELTSVMDGSFVENGTVSNLQEDESGMLSSSFTITTPILMDQEYSLKFIMKTKGSDADQKNGEEGSDENNDSEEASAKKDSDSQTYYYYTRVIQQTGTNLTDYLNYAGAFYTNCLDKDQQETIAGSIETNETNNSSTNFNDVNIESNIDMVTWGNLDPELYMGAVPQIKELNDETASIVMDYVITSVNKKDQTEYYHVKDYYRLHNNQGVMAMVDFERDVEQIFDPSLPVYTESGINLGVRSTSLEYVASDNDQYVAFVTNGELWLLDDADHGTVCRAFSFRSGNGIDERSINNSHDIKVCSVTDEGRVTFIVYGYMNSGDHEGETGVVIYTYTAGDNMLREQLFIPVEQNYEYMNYYLSSLTNVSDNGVIYMYTGETLQTIDLETGKAETALKNMNTECFATSDTQNYAAWMNEMDPYHSLNITVFNVKTGEERTISAAEGEKIKIIGFYGEDLVYGYAADGDIITDGAGNTVFGMNRICIETMEGEMLKVYQKDGAYITRLLWTGDHLELELSTRSESGFTYYGSDHIVSNTGGEKNDISVVTEKDNRCSQQVILPFMKGSSSSSVVSKVSDYTINYKKKTVDMSIPALAENQYLVYYNGGLRRIDTMVNNGIHAADENGGIVLDGQQKYVYERGNWRQTITLEPETLPQELLDPVLDTEVIQNVLGSGYKVINYTGCSIESIRYQISRGYPVVAKYSEDRTVLLLGYDRWDNLWYYDVGLGEVKAIGDIDAAAIFGSMGNVFVSYIRTDVTSAEAEAALDAADSGEAAAYTETASSEAPGDDASDTESDAEPDSEPGLASEP